MSAFLTSAWNFPARILNGIGRISDLAETCRADAIAKALVVTDRGLGDLRGF